MDALPKFNSPELRVFKLYFAKLVETIPSWMSTMLFANDLISMSLHKDVVKTTNELESSKVIKLLLAVEDQLVVNPSLFCKFLSVLRGDSSLVYIADAMSNHYRKYVHSEEIYTFS